MGVLERKYKSMNYEHRRNFPVVQISLHFAVSSTLSNCAL